MVRRFEVVSEFEELPKEERPILPKRQTKHSAGYDFYAFEDIVIPAHGEAGTRTGIKVCMPADEHLESHIRSSYGIKKGLMLNNCVGIIDADYYNNPDNEGEIMARLRNFTDHEVVIERGDRFMQGIFTKHYLVDNDNADGERVGGVGSTSGNTGETKEVEFVSIAGTEGELHFDSAELTPWGYISSEEKGGCVELIIDTTEIKKVSDKDFLSLLSVLKKIKND